MEMKYTGRNIAIINNIGGVLEPLEAIALDMQQHGITEAYSLGNNIGNGPDSDIVIDTLIGYSIKSVAGPIEKYCTYRTSFSDINIINEMLQTRERLIPKLREERLKVISTFPNYFVLDIGGTRITICHNESDISEEEHSLNSSDVIIQSGTVHSKYTITNDIPTYTIKSSVPLDKNCIATASYIVLCEKEQDKGFDIIERTVFYDERALHSPNQANRVVSGKAKRLIPLHKIPIQPQV